MPTELLIVRFELPFNAAAELPLVSLPPALLAAAPAPMPPANPLPAGDADAPAVPLPVEPGTIASPEAF